VYLYAKIFHLIGMVSWMAGLFYLPRLFVYHAEAQDKPEAQRALLARQFAIMEQRLLNIITTPALVMTWIGGAAMLWLNPALLTQRWMVVKLVLLVLLAGFHGWMVGVTRRLGRNERVMTAERFRVMNEVPTVALVLICTYAVLRDSVGLFAGLGISAVMVLLLGLGIQAYGVVRKRNEARDAAREAAGAAGPAEAV
jgi:putative membrane protein